MGLHPLKSFDPRPLTENKEQHIRHETKTCNLTKYHRSQILHFPVAQTNPWYNLSKFLHKAMYDLSWQNV